MPRSSLGVEGTWRRKYLQIWVLVVREEIHSDDKFYFVPDFILVWLLLFRTPNEASLLATAARRSCPWTDGSSVFAFLVVLASALEDLDRASCDLIGRRKQRAPLPYQITRHVRFS